MSSRTRPSTKQVSRQASKQAWNPDSGFCSQAATKLCNSDAQLSYMIYYGLQVPSMWVLLGLTIRCMGTWTLRACQAIAWRDILIEHPPKLEGNIFRFLDRLWAAEGLNVFAGLPTLRILGGSKKQNPQVRILKPLQCRLQTPQVDLPSGAVQGFGCRVFLMHRLGLRGSVAEASSAKVLGCRSNQGPKASGETRFLYRRSFVRGFRP